MTDIISPLSAAISLVGRLRTISATIRDAEFKNLLAELNIELAEAKIKLAEVIDENFRLKREIEELSTPKGELCPSCAKPTWRVTGSQRDAMFGDLGGIRRTYKCEPCGYTESVLVAPK